jgi:subtilisin family serine protease
MSSKNHPGMSQTLFQEDPDVPSPWGEFVPSLQRCEDRLVMSAIPMLDMLHHDLQEDLGSLPIYGPAPTVPQSINPSSATLLSHVLTNDAANLPSPIEDNSNVSQQASSAHLQTGWVDSQQRFGLTGAGQTVAVIDSGIAWDHVALGGGFGPGYRVVGGWDFAESDSNPYDDRPAGFHGTHVAGIIGASDATRSGVASGVDLVALRVFDDAGKGQLSWVENALQWVHQNKNKFEFPITTVNLSLGSTWNGSTIPAWASLEDELQALRNDGIVVVASAGNSFKQYNTPGLSYPASSSLVIPVSSVDSNGMLSDFSQRHDRAIAAPGRSIFSTVPDHFLGTDGIINDWALSSGTSMAAPYVAGTSVLVREAMQLAGWSSISPTGIYNWLMETSDSVFDNATNASYDRLNLGRAIANLIPADQVGDDWSSALAITLQNRTTTDGWINTLGDRDVYRFTAPSSGTVILNSESSRLQDSSWTLWSNGQSTSLSGNPTSASGTSFSVVAGQSYAIGINDSDRIGPYQLQWQFNPSNASPGSGESSSGTEANASQFGIVRNGSDLQILGTSNSDRYQIDISNGVRIEVDGKTFNFNPGLIGNIQVDLKGGDDLLHVIGGTASEKIDFTSGRGTIESASIKMSIANAEQLEFTGGGGFDRAYIVGTNGDDVLTAKPRFAEMTGTGYRLQINDVQSIYVDATQAGQDSAYFYDSVGDDRLSVRPQFSSMSGGGFFNYAAGIERVYAYSNAGGIDSATLYDSASVDTFNTSGDVASIVGPNFFSYTRFFEKVEAVSSAGGRDIAAVYATDGNSILVGSDFSGYQDSQWSRIARGFSDARTFVNNQLLSVRGFAVEEMMTMELASSTTAAASASELNADRGSDIAMNVSLIPNVVVNAGARVDMLVDSLMHSLATSFEVFASSSIDQEAIDILELSSPLGFIRLPMEEVTDNGDRHYESLLVDLEDERRWIEAIFAEHDV